jgi:hypothetical protein
MARPAALALLLALLSAQQVVLGQNANFTLTFSRAAPAAPLSPTSPATVGVNLGASLARVARRAHARARARAAERTWRCSCVCGARRGAGRQPAPPRPRAVAPAVPTNEHMQRLRPPPCAHAPSGRAPPSFLSCARRPPRRGRRLLAVLHEAPGRERCARGAARGTQSALFSAAVHHMRARAACAAADASPARRGRPGARLFGVGGVSGTLQSTVPGTWGNALDDTPVYSSATFAAALAALRAPDGHDPSRAASFPRPPQFAAVDSILSTPAATTPDAIDGAPAATVAALASIGITPLVVTQIGCSSFDFSTDAPADAAYWAERWELYKHQYVLSRWTWVRGITKIECASRACVRATDCVVGAARGKLTSVCVRGASLE